MYDIHGSSDTLEAVIADPSAAQPDAIVVGDDAVLGPFCLAAVDRLGALQVPVHYLRGTENERPPA